MSALRRMIGGVRALFRKHRAEQELDEELRAYLETSTAEKVRAGMTPEDAARRARVEMGSVEAVKEYVRDVGWERRLESCWHDLRYAMRTLRKSPTFAAVVIVTLALGIGANTAIFSLVNAVMLRPLPVERPEELISLTTVYPDSIEPVFSYPAYRRFAVEGAPIADVIAASAARRDAITFEGPPEPIDLKWVSGNYFTTLGVQASIGRTLLPSDDQSEGAQTPERVAVISDAYWTRRFGRSASVAGRTFRFRAATFTIVGVAPRGFFGETRGEAPDLWMPLTAQPAAPSYLWRGHSTTWLAMVARLRPDVTLTQARVGFERVYDRIRTDVAEGETSAEFRQSVLDSRLAIAEARGGSARLRRPLSAPLLVLMGIVALVLLITCANVANLMLARAVAHRRETALSLALGAARLRVVRHRLFEAFLLAALGGLAGLAIASQSSAALVALVSGALPLSIDASLDARVLAFTVLVSSATAILFGLLPALREAGLDPLSALKIGGGSAGTIRVALRRSLVVAQVAVSLVLLVVAALFVRSLLNLKDVDIGFDPDRVLLFQVTPPVAEQPLSMDAKRDLYRQLLARAEAVPGVHRASASVFGVFTNATWRNAISVEGLVPRPGVTPRTYANSVTPQYFDVMQIAVVRGRGFTDADHDTAPRVAVVSQAFVRQFFGDVDPIGKHVEFCTSDPCGAATKGPMEIVGVTEDVKYVDLREQRRSMLYVPFTQYDQSLREIAVRTTGDPSAIAATLHRELASVDSRIAIVSMLVLRDRVETSMLAERLIARLSVIFGVLALALAAIGLYGMVAYVTTQRTGEIGVRMALGACRRDVRRLVLRDTLTLVAIGAAIGIPVALAGARLFASQLYEVGPDDPLAVTLSLATLSLAAVVAGALPARRAARVDPVVALRNE